MARIQEYHGPSELYTSPPQPRPRFFYDINSSAAECLEASMAQPLLQSPFRPEHCMPQSQWSPPWLSSNNMVSMPNQLWAQQTVSGHDVTRTGVSNEPHMDESMFTNSDLLYSHNASQNTLNKAMDFGSSSFWPLDGLNNAAPSPSEDILLSPGSPFSDAKHTYSPGSDFSPTTPERSAASYSMSSGMMKVASPSFVPPTPHSVIQQHPGSTALQRGFGAPMTSAGPFHIGSTFAQTDDATIYGSEHSYHSQSGSSGMTTWCPPGYTGKNTAIVQNFQHQQEDTLPFDSRPNSFLAPLERNSRQRQGQWSNKSTVPAQSHFQSRFVTPMTDKEKAQRTKDDEILLEMKRDGYTYKDIRKALGRRVAESTLRGRYRSLTKPRSDRVRAPKWTETDILLLKRYVQEEFDKLDVTQPSLETKQKPDKVPWAKIVETIAVNGGTYKFGAATAKKKWREVSHSASTRPSRRRSQT